MDHELAFVKSFIVKSKQSRYLEKLASPKHRREFLSRLHHNLDYDPQFAEQIPVGAQSTALILQALRQLGAPENCHAIAAGSDLDGKDLPLAQALTAVVGAGDGVVLSCIPGKLAYYEAEHPNGRYVLQHR